MSAEFFATFTDQTWLSSHGPEVIQHLVSLETFVKKSGNEFWFRGTEVDPAPGRWNIDVRMFLQPGNRLLLEVSAHPKSIESDLQSFLAWLRSQTPVEVMDEDGGKSSW